MKNGIVNIKGKEYHTVAKRVADFRKDHSIEDGWAILTELLECSADQVIMKAMVNNEKGATLATGYAQERWTGRINTTSAVENCETSAIGRALAACGMAGGGEYASANEVQGAIATQNAGLSNQPPPKSTESAQNGPVGSKETKEASLMKRTRKAFSEAQGADGLLAAIERIAVRRAEFGEGATYRRCLTQYTDFTAGFSKEDVGRISAAVSCLLGDVAPDTEKEAANVF